MDAHEASDLAESGLKQPSEKRGPLLISLLAVLLALASLGGSNATKDAMQASILAANDYAFYQAKTIRQNALKLAASELELKLNHTPGLSGAAKADHDARIQEYRKTMQRYESEPETGEGRRELIARAQSHEMARDLALRKDPWFDYGEGLLQIAIVLVSVSMIAGVPSLMASGAMVGLLGILSTLNGYFLVI